MDYDCFYSDGEIRYLQKKYDKLGEEEKVRFNDEISSPNYNSIAIETLLLDFAISLKPDKRFNEDLKKLNSLIIKIRCL